MKKCPECGSTNLLKVGPGYDDGVHAHKLKEYVCCSCEAQMTFAGDDLIECMTKEYMDKHC